jgi:phage-related baseplate assembly protein
VKLVVAATSNVAVDLAGEVTLVSGADAAVVAAGVEAALSAYLAGLDSGEAVLVAELVAAAMAVEGVANIKLTAPMADVAVNADEKAIKGAYAFT